MSAAAPQQTFALSNDEKITLLEELHRPLEEHWSVKTKFGLDAKSSEYIYKHHITRLEDIYTNHKTHNQNVPGLLYMSPVSQLYGMNGLNVDDNPEKQRKKEQKWVSNFQKHAFLSEGGDREHEGEKNKTNKSGSYSPGRLRNSHSAGSSRHDKRKMDTESDSADNRNTRSKCFDPHVSKEDLLMMGLYRLNDEQEDIYRRFVDMVSTFDEFDRANILNDARKDAHNEEELLEGYGGTELPPPSHGAATGAGGNHYDQSHTGGPFADTHATVPPPMPPHTTAVARGSQDFRPSSAGGRR
eukprot:CAMPEP_0184999548 /NCGR_PEP_ID=MMETSP1098-20130426/65824_1 /TAXON_ID=89044 /ORGANISM="Spumella elongata, Strain CCAP 955/1" /LENGTH=298 /DNA_ID=CAMNT_0027526561 /DNA_START=49 /DNA_END=945 /DNA_ORIENTATION=-